MDTITYHYNRIQAFIRLPADAAFEKNDNNNNIIIIWRRTAI